MASRHNTFKECNSFIKIYQVTFILSDKKLHNCSQ